jgi:acetyl-CoA carboxylase biotin carboxyl carrier protein
VATAFGLSAVPRTPSSLARGGTKEKGIHDVAEDLSSLSEDDLQRLLRVIESLERSDFDFLQLEVGGMKVVLGKGSPADYASPIASATALPAAGAPSTSAVVSPTSEAASFAEPSVPLAPRRPSVPSGPLASPQASRAESDLVEIVAPMMGIFYAQPEPGAPPFVSVGSPVTPETTVALVEVMKMFNAVTAGVAGTIVEVLVENNQLVEYHQPLFRVRPS